ncbi:MAG TPA: response regulator [Bryobacteraceae bacterium]|nr:response regulator [Bryobacteraceae bacterium]
MRDRVLLHVEDEDITAFLLETVLSESKVPVRLWRVGDGEEAIAFLKQTGKHRGAPRPDLVLLDLNLPRRTGLEILAEIRKSDGLRSLPVVVFTSSAHLADRRNSLALGASEFITKPRSLPGMLEAIHKACSYFPQAGSEL